MELVDPPTIGGKFTWSNSGGSAMSRLDKFLLSDNFIVDWKVEGQTIVERDVSDHAPIWIKDNKRNWGPKPFRFNNMWFDHEKFFMFVEGEWRKIRVKGNVPEDMVVGRARAAIDFWENLNKKEERRRRNSLCALEARGGRLEDVTDIKEFIHNHFNLFFNDIVEERPVLSGVNLKPLSVSDSHSIERPFSEMEVKEAIWSCDGNKSAGLDGYSLEFYKRFWVVIREDVLRLCNDFHDKGTLVKSITSSFLALIPKNNNPQNLGEYRPICLVGSIYKIISKILAARLKEVIDTLVSNNQTAFVPGRNKMDGVLLVNELLDWMKKKKRGSILLKVDFEKAYDSVSWQYLKEMMMRMGFGERWMKWMDSCIFKSHISVLVNGSATKEFKVNKGLRQGDPLSPFLFVLAMEGLTTLVRKSIEVGDFKPFKYGEEDYADILQFADDTIILGKSSCDNLWSLKVLLRGFELVSGLKINFAKSNIIGVNVGDSFLNAAKAFLSCNKGSIPFKFLGIMVGESHRKKKVWAEVINKIKGRLSSWKGKNLSMGGRVTLVNSVLNAIPTFTLSFFKAPTKVIKEIRRLQSDFLWGGSTDKKCIHWVKWKYVCRPKEKGGLGVRDVEEVNKALLLKWKWRILKEDNAIWSKFFSLRYPCPKLKLQVPNGDMNRSDDSIWWRDITKNNLIDDFIDGGFSGCFSCCCKDGKNILFWHSLWLGDQSLRELYPDLFDMSTIKNCAIADVLVWNNGNHFWELEALFRGGAATVFMGGAGSVFLTGAATSSSEAAVRGFPCWSRFCADIYSFTPNDMEADSFRWRINPEKEFSVSSILDIVNDSKSFVWPNQLSSLLKVMWELKIPPKMHIFAWRFFIEKIPSKDELLNRGVTCILNSDCVFCGNHPEVFSHLFFNCHVVKEIWTQMYGWLGIEEVLNGVDFLDFGAIQDKVKNANHRLKINIVWIAIIWCIWLMRNAIIFKGEAFSFDVVCSNTVFLSWRWLSVGYAKFSAISYEWFKLPLSCSNAI
ncbi:uncharacterized protein LOC131597115 [Vicia villosa]|uniref:uncharacterized protein LOC131597115 n=1 Tax=Vicia villosa TaxID=3911 RepID=UPI00273B2257|nr:uncharacterized protein LOC131597115 [Vicia villosa]